MTNLNRKRQYEIVIFLVLSIGMHQNLHFLRVFFFFFFNTVFWSFGSWLYFKFYSREKITAQESGRSFMCTQEHSKREFALVKVGQGAHVGFRSHIESTQLSPWLSCWIWIAIKKVSLLQYSSHFDRWLDSKKKNSFNECSFHGAQTAAFAILWGWKLE